MKRILFCEADKKNENDFEEDLKCKIRIFLSERITGERQKKHVLFSKEIGEQLKPSVC